MASARPCRPNCEAWSSCTPWTSIASMPMGLEDPEGRGAASMAMRRDLWARRTRDVDRPGHPVGFEPLAHRWHGHRHGRARASCRTIPTTSIGSLPIDGAARYEIHGKVKAAGAGAGGPLSSIPGAPGASGGPVREHLEEAGSIRAERTFPRRGTARFVITVDSSPPAGAAKSSPDL